jgi:hypothetical protein
MLAFQSTAIDRHYSAPLSSLFFYPTLFPSLILSYPLTLSPLLFSPKFFFLCLYYSVFPAVFPILVLMSCTCVVSSSSNSLLFCTSLCNPLSASYFKKNLNMELFHRTFLRTSSFQPYQFTTKATSQKKVCRPVL